MYSEHCLLHCLSYKAQFAATCNVHLNCEVFQCCKESFELGHGSVDTRFTVAQSRSCRSDVHQFRLATDAQTAVKFVVNVQRRLHFRQRFPV